MRNEATMSMQQRNINGTPVVVLRVRWASSVAGLKEICDAAGIVCVTGISNLREKMCHTEAELLAAREPLMSHVAGPAVDGIVNLI